MRNKLYFISDAHLGAGEDTAFREHEICQLLDTMKQDAQMLVILGDMFDFWFSYKYLVPRGHVRLLGKLAELADEGVKIHYYIGNHDMWVFDYLEKELGATMHNEPDMLFFDGKRFLVGHGDGLGHFDRKYDCLKKVFRSRFCQKLFVLLPSRLTFHIAHSWSASNKKKHAKENLQHYLGDDREGIVIYSKERLEREVADYCVFGHRHTPLSRNIEIPGKGSVPYVNVGDWLEHKSYAVYADGELKLIEQ